MGMVFWDHQKLKNYKNLVISGPHCSNRTFSKTKNPVEPGFIVSPGNITAADDYSNSENHQISGKTCPELSTGFSVNQ